MPWELSGKPGASFFFFFSEPGMEIPYFNDQEHGQLLLSLENGINDLNSTAYRGGNANQVSSSHEVILCTIDAHLHVKCVVIIGLITHTTPAPGIESYWI